MVKPTFAVVLLLGLLATATACGRQSTGGAAKTIQTTRRLLGSGAGAGKSMDSHVAKMGRPGALAKEVSLEAAAGSDRYGSAKAFERVQAESAAADAVAARRLMGSGAGAGKSMDSHVAKMGSPSGGGAIKQALLDSAVAGRFTADDRVFMTTQADTANAVTA